MKQILLIFFFLISLIGSSQTKYTISTIPEAIEINYDISIKKGYDLNKKTVQVFELIPKKYCLVDSGLYVVLKLNIRNQEYYFGELHERSEVNFIDTVLTEIELHLEPDVEKWFLDRYIENENLNIILN